MAQGNPGRFTNAKKKRMWHKAITALMNEPTLPAAARAIGVHPNTITAWLREPSFMELLREAQDNALGQAIIAINGRITESVNVLHKIVMDDEVQPAVRVAAVAKELEIVLKSLTVRANEETVRRLTEEIASLKAQQIGNANAEEKALPGTTASRPKRTRSSRVVAELLPANPGEGDEGDDPEG